MITFELYYEKFERLQQIHQLSNKSSPTTKEAFETLESAYIDMK